MKAIRADLDLEASVAEYKQAIAAYTAHQASKREALKRILPPEYRPTFQHYLDHCGNQTKTADGVLYLPVDNHDLMAWGASIESGLSAVHNKSETLKKEVYDCLTRALHCLGSACVDWIAPRADKNLLEGIVQPAFALASQYRERNIDGIPIITTDGPFISGLSKRLGIKPADIYKKDSQRVSAFEMAYWAIADRDPNTHEVCHP